MKPHSVLIIEDDVWFRRVFSKIMREEGFYQRYQATNGYEGISLAVEHEPTLILLDILMPELDGEKTLKILKQLKTVQNIPVIVISASLDPELVNKMIDLGAAEIIGKPFTLATLQKKLEKVFGQDNLERIKNGNELDMSYFQIKNDDEYYDDEFTVADEFIEDSTNLMTNNNGNKETKSKERISITKEERLKIYNASKNKDNEEIKNILGDLSPNQ